MNQFKPIFLGTVGATEAFASLKRAADTQKVRLCLLLHNASSHVKAKLTSYSVSELVESIT